MRDDKDEPLEKEFQKRCDVESEPDRWLIHPVGDTDFEKGVRRGIEVVLAAIREGHGHFDLWLREDGELWLCLSLYENLTYREDFTRVIGEFINDHKGGGPDNSNELKFFAAFLRATAEEVDTAINWKPKPHPRRRQEALEEEP